MSVLWTLIATFLYVEIAIVLLLVLPVASPYKWNRLFKSKFLATLQAQWHMYFFLILGLLVLSLIEAVREMRKYSHQETVGETHLNVEMQHNMRLFRAQRNFYISGFSIFLVLVIRRLVTLISAQANLLAQNEASMKQAKSATAAAKVLMTEKSQVDKDATENKALAELTELRQSVQDLSASLARERKDKEALKSQAEGLNREYDKLTEEYSKLQKQITIGVHNTAGVKTE